MSSAITVSRGEVVGIGKIKIFPSNSRPYEIPMLSFLVVKERENVYTSICIHLRIDGDGASPEEARENMKEHILDFLHGNFTEERAQGPAWDYLKELFLLDDTTRELWDAYRALQVKFSQDGIKTDITAELLDRIKGLQDQIDKLNAVKELLKNNRAEEPEISLEYKEVA
jgi:hypothetical protein